MGCIHVDLVVSSRPVPEVHSVRYFLLVWWLGLYVLADLRTQLRKTYTQSPGEPACRGKETGAREGVKLACDLCLGCLSDSLV